MTFHNTAPTDFVIAENRDAFASALEAQVQRSQSDERLEAAPYIGGERISSGLASHECTNPSEPSHLLGSVYYASPSLTRDAIQALRAAAPAWAATPTLTRCSLLDKAADLMEERRHNLAALMVLEAGKPWREADADVVEAIDFLRYYADQMKGYAQPVKTDDILGEDNYYFYKAKGVAAVIAPWNFPLAILTGMTAAALVTGNTVVVKPAEQTSLIAAEMYSLFIEAGIPGEVLAFLPGDGEEIGPVIVQHPEIDVICFTGSMAVGLEIIQSASVVQPNQRNVKRVIAEMGGKNAIIVDEDADLDEAIKGVLYSTFGFAGQKCSACSRLIAVGTAYEPFLKRLAGAARDLRVGPAADPATVVGPVIDETAQKRLLFAIEEAERTHTLVHKGETPAAGHFVPPAIFRDVGSTQSLWNDELFGPVLACTKAVTFDEALELANNSPYKLTGGLFSRSPKNIERAIREFDVGNLYINRTCTGAIVKRQPFGGYGMSGVGSKAGGPDYLLQFMDPRTVSENAMRRGMTPEFT